MDTIQVDILNLKAEKLLQDLADMNLISIKDATGDGFLKVVAQLRKKAQKNPPNSKIKTVCQGKEIKLLLTQIFG